MVKFKIFDGEERTLGDVAYASCLQCNLISSSKLDSMGYKCSIVWGHENYKGLHGINGRKVEWRFVRFDGECK